MENFRRINANSILIMADRQQFLNDSQWVAAIEHDKTILQLCNFGDDTIIIEALPKTALTENKKELETDFDFENYLDTVINRDPFGAKYSGKKIKDIFIAGDKDWLDNALKNMKNEFIRERLQYIVDRGGYGKINC